MAHARQEIRLGLTRGLRHRLGLQQLRLHALALGDVTRRCEDPLQRALSVVKRGCVIRHYRLLAVSRASRKLVVGDLSLVQYELDSCFGSFRIGEIALEG